MISYRCRSCNLDCETSECPVCKQRSDIVGSKIYWCEECNIPLYNNACIHEEHNVRELTTDIRPVFPQERLLLEILIGEPFKFINSSVWNAVGNRYFIDGKHLKISLEKLMQRSAPEVISERNRLKEYNSYENFNKYINLFIDANKGRFNEIETDAMKFINEQQNNFTFDETFVSFSGGKDSTVVSDLAIRALGTQKVLHIFGDTTLEFPFTMEYKERFRVDNPKVPFLSARNKEKNFYDMCEVIGPPSRVMRWCCIVFKTGAITRRLDKIFKNKKRVLTYYGIRRSESVSRNKYDKVSQSPKITKQHVVSPIIDWYDFDIWLYILTRGIDFNYAYRLGYSRVGCWCCPNNSKWAQYLSSIYMPDEYDRWRSLLINFAVKIGKPDADVYVDEGKWKARQGGNGLAISKSTLVEFKPCVTSTDSFNYDLNMPLSPELYELFKPFGWLDYDMGNRRLGQVYVKDRNNNPSLILEGRLGERTLKVTIINTKILGSKSLRDVKQKVDCQITKYQMCLGCLGCESVCKLDAITIKKAAHDNENSGKKNNEYYKINSEKCTRCGKCINHFDGGCYMRKVLITKRGE
jgi:phosphoadenosine phosphosulfate reductase